MLTIISHTFALLVQYPCKDIIRTNVQLVLLAFSAIYVHTSVMFNASFETFTVMSIVVVSCFIESHLYVIVFFLKL